MSQWRAPGSGCPERGPGEVGASCQECRYYAGTQTVPWTDGKGTLCNHGGAVVERPPVASAFLAAFDEPERATLDGRGLVDATHGGRWRVFVVFDRDDEDPSKGEGWDFTATPGTQDECNVLLFSFGHGAKWRWEHDQSWHHVKRAWMLEVPS